jgi:uncharacterized protein with HXXEE motif
MLAFSSGRVRTRPLALRQTAGQAVALLARGGARRHGHGIGRRRPRAGSPRSTALRSMHLVVAVDCPMSLIALGWLFTLGVLAHNVEEALYLPSWSSGAGRWHVHVGEREFRLAVAVLSAALVAIVAAASYSGAASPAAYALSGYALAMVLNVLVPHTMASIALGRYMPGTATAVLFNLPLGCMFLTRAVAEGYVHLSVLAWVGPLTVLAILGSIPVLFAIGRKTREHDRGSPCA